MEKGNGYIKKYEPYYNTDIQAWMRTGSNRVFPDRDSAQRSADRANAARARYYRNLDISLTYADIYNKIIFPADIQNVSEPGGTSEGKGFYNAWSGIWFGPSYETSSRTIKELANMAMTDVAVYNFLLRVRRLSPNVRIRHAITVLLDYPDD